MDKNKQCNDKQNVKIGGVVNGMRARDYTAPSIQGHKSGKEMPSKTSHTK